MRSESRIERGSPRKKVAVQFVVVSMLVALALLAVPYQAAAIDIQMTFKSASSDNPSDDSDGALLTAMMASVEAYYEDIFECAGTLEVEFYYEALDGTTLSVHNNLATSGGKPTKCRIRIDNDRTWYYDPTPTDNSEYNMTRTLARDLTSSQKTSYFTGTPHDFLEVSNKGSANWDTAPWDCILGHDLYSVMLHEMGHGLGMTANVASSETSDYDYDFDADLVWGTTLAAKCYATDNRYHLKAATMMYPSISSGKRILPSATDLFSIETAATWGDTSIDLPQKDFYSADANADFSAPGNWSGNHLPDSADDVWVRDGGTSTLSAPVTMHNLIVGETANTIYTGAYKLYATGNATLGDGTNAACVSMQTGGEFQVNYTLTVANNADVLMATGSLLDVDTLTVNPTGEITGAGTIDIEDGFTLNGTLTVSGGDLAIDSDVNVNLDGAGTYDGNGKIYVTGGNFSCNKALTDNFTGYIQVNSSCTATFTEGWRLLTGGTLYLNGNTDKVYRAAIDGGLFKVAGTVNVNHQCRTYCDTEFESSAVVTLTDTDDTLYVQSNSMIAAGANFSGAGRLYSNANFVLEDGAVVGVRMTNNNTLTVEENGIGSATINGAFDTRDTKTMFFEVDGDGSCDLLDINAAFTIDGILSIDFISDYMPEVGDSFTVLTYNSRVGTFDSIVSDNLAVTLSATYSSTALTLLVTAVDAMQAVPEPSTWMLLTSMLLAFGYLKRKR